MGNFTPERWRLDSEVYCDNFTVIYWALSILELSSHEFEDSFVGYTDVSERLAYVMASANGDHTKNDRSDKFLVYSCWHQTLSSSPSLSSTLSLTLLLQQPNFKQKFVALLKRFKVTDEVSTARFNCSVMYE